MLDLTPRSPHDDDLHIPGLRSFPVDNYIIYYCPIDSKGVVIVRVFHAARDLESLLDD